MITGFEDPQGRSAATLGRLAQGTYSLPEIRGRHWAEIAPDTLARCARELLDLGHSTDAAACAMLVPGRIEVLGKHTDYAGGRSLLAAVERGFTFVSVRRTDLVVRVSALDLRGRCEFPLSAELQPASGWPNYAMTVARRLARDFPGSGCGVDLAFTSDLPAASGMSSSSALVIGTFLSLAAWSGLMVDASFQREVRDLDDLAGYLAAVESGQGFGALAGDAGVGTHGGSEDHTAILQASEGSLLRYRFVPAACEGTIPLPEGYSFAIAASGVAAEKTGAMRERYNRASALARELQRLWAQETGGPAPASLAAALRSAPDAVERLRAAVKRTSGSSAGAAELLARLDHLVQESEILLPAAAAALAAGDLERFGAHVDASQRLAEELLHNQTPETIELARSARNLGAAAASAFGAGYGGSVWALLPVSRVSAFLRQWRGNYARAFPEAAGRAEFFSSSAGPAARRVA